MRFETSCDRFAMIFGATDKLRIARVAAIIPVHSRQEKPVVASQTASFLLDLELRRSERICVHCSYSGGYTSRLVAKGLPAAFETSGGLFFFRRGTSARSCRYPHCSRLGGQAISPPKEWPAASPP